MVMVPGVRVIEFATMVAITGDRERSGTATTASATFDRGRRTVTATSHVATTRAHEKKARYRRAAKGRNLPSCSGSSRPGPVGNTKVTTATTRTPLTTLATVG